MNAANYHNGASFPLDSEVVLHSLSKGDFNGKIGTIKGPILENGRQQVYLKELDKSVSLKVENLKLRKRESSSSKKKKETKRNERPLRGEKEPEMDWSSRGTGNRMKRNERPLVEEEPEMDWSSRSEMKSSSRRSRSRRTGSDDMDRSSRHSMGKVKAYTVETIHNAPPSNNMDGSGRGRMSGSSSRRDRSRRLDSSERRNSPRGMDEFPEGLGLEVEDVFDTSSRGNRDMDTSSRSNKSTGRFNLGKRISNGSNHSNSSKGGIAQLVRRLSLGRVVSNTAKNGVGLAAGGVGLAARGAAGGVGLAARGVGRGVGKVANTAKAGVGGTTPSWKNASPNPFANEMCVYGSEVYSVEFVEKEIQKAKENQEINKLVVEDLILRGDQDLNQLALNLLNKTAMVPTDQCEFETASSKSRPKRHLDINVQVFGGSDLTAMDVDLLGRETTSDPYLIVSVLSKGKETVVGQTPHKLKTLNPTWNVNLSSILPPSVFSAKDPFTVQLKIMDYDMVGDDDCMGIVEIPMEPEPKGSSSSHKISKAPAWYTVPNAGGRIKVAVESKLCFGASEPETKFERHWRKLVFCDNIASVEDYHGYRTRKADFQANVRKVLNRKGIKVFPVRFEARVEVDRLDIYETIALLGLMGDDDTIIQFDIQDPEIDSLVGGGSQRNSNHQGASSTRPEVKKLPKSIANRFDPETLEWKEDAVPLVMHLKYGTKPPAPDKRRRSSSFFQHCSSRLEAYAKKSSNFDMSESMSFGCFDASDADFVAFGRASVSNLGQ